MPDTTPEAILRSQYCDCQPQPEPLGWIVLYRYRPDARWHTGTVGVIHDSAEAAEHQRQRVEARGGDVVVAVLYPATTQEPTP